MPEAFIAEVDDCAPRTPSHPANNQAGADMDIDWEQERLRQDKAIERILAERDPSVSRKGSKPISATFRNC